MTCKANNIKVIRFIWGNPVPVKNEFHELFTIDPIVR
jgi:hypothetical protein